MNIRISEKGQVTIPKFLRMRLGLRPGDTLNVEEENGRLVATKALSQDAVDAVYGILRLQGSTDALMTDLRGEADGL